MRNREAEKYQYKSIKILEKKKSQVEIVKTKMAERHVTQPVKDVSISTQMDRDFPITTLMLCEVYPDAQLNTTTMMWALYIFTISSLMDVWTTWGVQTTRYCVRELLHLLSFPAVPPLMSPASSTSSTIYSGVEATAATGPSPSPVPATFLALGAKKGPGEGGHGEERGDEGLAGVRNCEEFLVLMYSTRKLSTATNQLLYLV